MEKLYVLSLGVVNPNSGKTIYDWNIFDEWKSGMTASLATGGHLIFGAGQGLETGSEYILENDQTRRKIKSVRILDSCQLAKENLLTMLKKNNYDYTPLRPFAKRQPGNKKLSTSYVLK